jgi:hypothetical protein
MRGRTRPKGPNPLTRSYESNGPDVKVRGTAQHIADKYAQLARDAQSSGDYVSAENYHQHAEHYYRLIATAQEALRQQYGTSPRPYDDEGEEGDEEGGGGYGPNGGADEMGEGPYQPQPYVNGDRQPQQRYDRNERYERGQGDRGQDRAGGDRGNQDRGGGGDRGGGERGNQQRYDRNDRYERGPNDRSARGGDRNGDRNGNNGGDRNQDRGYDRNGGSDRYAQDRGQGGPERNQDRAAPIAVDRAPADSSERMADRSPQGGMGERAQGERVLGERPARRERYDSRRERAPRVDQPRASGEDEPLKTELPAFLMNPVRPAMAAPEPRPEPAAEPMEAQPPQADAGDLGDARPKRRPRVRRTAEPANDVEKAVE